MSHDTNPTPARTRGAGSRIPESTRADPIETSSMPSQSSTTPNSSGASIPVSNAPIDPATFQQQMVMMMNLLTQNIVNIQGATRQSATPPPAIIREPKAKDPETFHGLRSSLNAFLTECDLVFELQPSRFQDDRVKVSYMISFLRDTPLLAIRPLLSETPRPGILDNYSSFVNHLRTNYGDPDEKGTARRKLKALRQLGPASTYFAEFQQYVAILGWKDQDPIIDKAIEGLKSNLKDEVARQGFAPKTLDELIMFIVPLDNRLYEREQERRREKDTREAQAKVAQPRSQNSNPTNPERRNGPPNLPSNQGPRQYRNPQDTRQVPPAGQPIQSAPRIFRGPITDAERQRRRDHDLCLRCGKPGHRAADCTTYRQPENTNAPVKSEDNPKDNSGNANGPPN
jgi:hypothetical protein